MFLNNVCGPLKKKKNEDIVTKLIVTNISLQVEQSDSEKLIITAIKP